MKSNCYGVGNDIIEIARIRESLSKFGHKILDRILTPREKEYCLSMRNPAIRFAGRFAAKEAVAKSLGCGFGELLKWRDIEIINDSAGKPEVTLATNVGKLHGSPHIILSISHCRNYATAVALCLKNMVKL